MKSMPRTSAQFHQIEGLYVDENVSVADLKRNARISDARIVRTGDGRSVSAALFSVHRAEF